MGTKRKPILLLALFIMLVVSLTGCETVLAILETPLFPQYYTNEQGIAFVSSPEQVFTVKISDPLILEIPITRSGYYEFINMEHPDILLYMGLYSKNIDKKDIIAENIIGDKPWIGISLSRRGRILLGRYRHLGGQPARPVWIFPTQTGLRSNEC